jgi:hypothetical protein
LKNKTLTHSNGHFTFQNAPHLSLFFFFPVTYLLYLSGISQKK